MKVHYVYCPQCGQELGEKVEEGLKRKACRDSACGFVYYNNPTPVVAILPVLGENVVLARHRDWPEKMLSTITGFVEEREEAIDAARRELQEELGLRAVSLSLIGVYMFAPFNQMLIAYHADCEGEIVTNDEIAETKLIPIHKLKGWGFGPGLAIRDWLAGREEQGVENG